MSVSKEPGRAREVRGGKEFVATIGEGRRSTMEEISE